jgi:AcrR family transcriptional regulator
VIKIRVVKKHDERRNEILDAAEKLFTEKGYVKTTINDILQEVGIAKGTFYYYFKSKEEVMDAVAVRYIDMGTEAVKKVVEEKNLTAFEKLKILFTADVTGSDKKDEILEEFHKAEDAEMHQRSLLMTIERLTPLITQIVLQGIEEKVFNTPYPKEIVEIILISLNTIFDEGLFQWEAEEKIQKAKALAYFMGKSLGAEKGSFDFMTDSVVVKD